MTRQRHRSEKSKRVARVGKPVNDQAKTRRGRSAQKGENSSPASVKYWGYLATLAARTAAAIGRSGSVTHGLAFEHHGVVVVGEADGDVKSLLEVAHPPRLWRTAEGQRGVDEDAVNRSLIGAPIVGGGGQPVVAGGGDPLGDLWPVEERGQGFRRLSVLGREPSCRGGGSEHPKFITDRSFILQGCPGIAPFRTNGCST